MRSSAEEDGRMICVPLKWDCTRSTPIDLAYFHEGIHAKKLAPPQQIVEDAQQNTRVKFSYEMSASLWR